VDLSKQAKKVKLATVLARKVIQRRAKLNALLNVYKEKGALSDSQRAEAMTLSKKIKSAKVAIGDLGYDPSEVLSAVSDSSKRKRKRSGLLGGGFKSGGVGAYGLGSSLKLWR